MAGRPESDRLPGLRVPAGELLCVPGRSDQLPDPGEVPPSAGGPVLLASPAATRPGAGTPDRGEARRDGDLDQGQARGAPVAPGAGQAVGTAGRGPSPGEVCSWS